MNTLNKILLGIGIAGAAIYIWARTSSVASMLGRLTITPMLDGSPKLKAGSGNFLTKLINTVTGGTYLQVPCAVKIQNRSDQSMKIALNSVMCYYEKELVASNTPGLNEISIAPNSTSTLEGINIEIPVTKLISLIGSAAESLLNAGSFSAITSKLEVKLGFVLGGTLVFDHTAKFGQSGEVDVNNSNPAVSGLGLAASTPRRIESLDNWRAYIPERSNLLHRDLIWKANGTVRDTANLMHQIARTYRGDTTDLAQKLEGNTLRETLSNIFNWVYTHVDYVRDSVFTEQVRRPLRAIYDQKGDCDCYATLIASMLENLGVPYKFRIAAYSAGRYQHVYVVVPTTENAQGYYTVDPVLDRCFAEKQPTKYFDV